MAPDSLFKKNVPFPKWAKYIETQNMTWQKLLFYHPNSSIWNLHQGKTLESKLMSLKFASLTSNSMALDEIFIPSGPYELYVTWDNNSYSYRICWKFQ